MSSATYVGIDVAKDKVDIAVRPSAEQWIAPQTEEGLRTLVARLVALAPALVVLEATGGYELPVAAALATAGVPVAVVNPRQVREFARGIGQLAKTDASTRRCWRASPRWSAPRPARCRRRRRKNSAPW